MRADRRRDAHLVVVEHDQHPRPAMADVVERLERQAADQRRVTDDDRDALVGAAAVARQRQALGDRQAGAGVAAIEDVVLALAPAREAAHAAQLAQRAEVGRAGPSAACGRTPGGRCPTPACRSDCRAADAARRSARRRPSELPRWPPVLATVWMIVPRSSAHSWRSCSSSSCLRSRGPVRLARMDKSCSVAGYGMSDERSGVRVVASRNFTLDASNCRELLLSVRARGSTIGRRHHHRCGPIRLPHL